MKSACGHEVYIGLLGSEKSVLVQADFKKLIAAALRYLADNDPRLFYLFKSICIGMPKTFTQSIRMTLKRWKLRKQGVMAYRNSVIANVEFFGAAKIEPYCRFAGDPLIVVGHRFYSNAHCHFLGEITIGDDVMFGPKCVVWGRDHGMAVGRPMKEQPHVRAPIVIGDDVWVGAGVTILKGVEIGDGAVIGAGSVVTKSIPPMAIAVGNPAKVVKMRS